MPISLSGRPRVSSRGTCLPAGRAALGAMDGPVVARERIAITLGDAAGIGPEVTLKAVHSVRRNLNAQILLLGRASFFHGLSKRLRLKMRFKDIADPADWAEDPSVLCCYSHGSMPAKVIRGKFSAALTKIAVRSIELAARLALDKKIDAIVTPPINKASLKKAGFAIPGHTEYLAELSKIKEFEMMLVGGRLRVVLVTRHLSIKDVPKNILQARVEKTILMTHKELRKSFGIRRPRIVVCGLNPHAGEEGRFGSEEINSIAPAVRSARKKTDAEIIGPLSPDALFHDAYLGRYDAEICMYHDQGLIPLKMISRGHGVNITLGLPFIRTSPDHGTGYDIANRFVADSGSMAEALNLAVRLSKNRKKYDQSHPRD